MVRKILIITLVISSLVLMASAGEVSFNNWSYDVTVMDNGTVDGVMRISLVNSGDTPVDGFYFVVPATSVRIIYDFEHTVSFRGLTAQTEKTQDGVTVRVNFNDSLEPENTWSGRIGFQAEGWAVKGEQDYYIEIPVEIPKVLTPTGEVTAELPGEDITSRIYLPSNFEVVLATPKPHNILFRYSHRFPDSRMIVTYFPPTGSRFGGNLKPGDKIKIKAVFNENLEKIVKVNDRLTQVYNKIQEYKKQGKDTSKAEELLEKANKYNNQDALGNFWKKNYPGVDQYTKLAMQELEKAENAIEEDKTETMTPTAEKPTKKETPATGLLTTIALLGLVAVALRQIKSRD